MKDRVTEILVLKVFRENFHLIEIVTTRDRASRNRAIVTAVGEKFIFSLWLVLSLTIHIWKDL